MNLKKDTLRLSAQLANWGAGVDFLVINQDPVTGEEDIGRTVEMRRVKECDRVSPTFTLSTMAVQGLMDSLWVAGFRPTENKRQKDHLGAVKHHLEDMRVIAFGGLDADLPERKD